eukprot:SAG11_NODE_28393_length_322_cov_0.699552_1_plen_20_part_10
MPVEVLCNRLSVRVVSEVVV